MTKTTSSIALLVRRTAVAVAAAATAVSTLFAAPAHAVIGGTPTTGDSFPYYVRVEFNGVTCGGSLIEHAVVLTAAHCAANAGGDVSKVKVFIKDRIPATATSITIHPLYNGNADEGHDLALVGISGNASSGVPVVRVGSPWDGDAYAVNTPATLVGHGSTSASGATSPDLQVLQTVLHSDDYMAGIYDPWWGPNHWNPTLMIGAGWSNQTACHGDSGGPLTVVRNGVITQVGVVSFVKSWPNDCADPAVYAELSGPQLAWIATQVPFVATSWGGCTTPHGTAGIWHVEYHSYFSPAIPQDGPNYWDIECMPPPQPAPPSPPKPPASDTKPLPTYCKTKPWMAACQTP
ncbi:MAG: trypsin-like serine protease [Actinobacteria bacterium]|nr:trypsin-like serine protease [Actinomycetota bacterium]